MTLSPTGVAFTPRDHTGYGRPHADQTGLLPFTEPANDKGNMADISLREAAVIAGIGYLVIFLFGLSNVRREKLIVRGDAAATASNIRASESRFRAFIATWIVMLVADVVVAWALYVFLKPAGDSLSLLTAWVRLVYVAVAAIAVVNLLSLLDLVRSADDSEAFQTDQINAQAMRYLSSYDFGFNVGYVFFGLHILGLGYLIVRLDYIPSVLGILLIVASVGYLIDSFASFLSSRYANNEAFFFVFVAVPAIISELSLTVWLLFWGG